MTEYWVMTKRKVKIQFFEQINTLIDWRPISNIINKRYVKGEDVYGCRIARKISDVWQRRLSIGKEHCVTNRTKNKK